MIFNDIMNQFFSHEIDKDGIIDLYSEKIRSSDLTIAFQNALADNDSILLENSIFVALILNMISVEHEKILLKLLAAKWHREHEDIVGLFQRVLNMEKESILELLKAVDNIPNYLQESDFKYPYIRKIIYAIGAQPEPDNINALEKLANETSDEQIKDLALHQIKKRKTFGRWEAAKNAQ